MKCNHGLLVGAALLVSFVAAPHARADLFPPGATLDVTYEDPTSGSRMTQTVPFSPNGSPSLLDGGVLSISEQTLIVNSTTEWVQFYLKTTSGGPLTFSSEYLLLNFNNVQLTQQAAWIDNYGAFTLNGKSSGDTFFDPLVTDPVTPSIGDVAHKGPFSPGPPGLFNSTVFFANPPAAYYIFADPIGAFFSSWGTDPNVDGYVGGVELEAQQPLTTPEPSTWTLCTAGLVILIGGTWWRRKRAA